MTPGLSGPWYEDSGPDDERPEAEGLAPVKVALLTRGLVVGPLAVMVGLLVASWWWEPSAGMVLAARSTLPAAGGTVSALGFSPDGLTLVAAAGDTVRIWGTASRRKIADIPTGTGQVRGALSPDGLTLASANCGPTVALWDVGRGKRLGAIEAPGHKFVSLAFSPDGRTLAAADMDGSVTLWETATARPRGAWREHAEAIGALAFSPDGLTLASGGEGGEVVLRDVRDGQTRAAIRAHTSSIKDHAARVVSLAFSPDGRTLASAGFSDPTVKTWDAADGRPIASFEAHAPSATFATFLPGGRTLISAGLDGRVLAWDLETGRSRPWVAGLGRLFLRVAVSPDGKILATAEGTKVTLWRPPSAERE